MQFEQLLKLESVTKINDISIAAGDAIMQIYQRDFEIVEKQDNSPLTEADLASHKTIVAALRELTPDIPILSEESASIDWSERKTWSTYWLIDPLDGTKEFIKRNGEFTVNIALIHHGAPVLGVVYAPVLNTLYFGSSEIGSWKQVSAKDSVKIAVKGELNPNEPVKVVGSRSHQSDEMLDYLKQFADYELVPMGSSLKICLIAEGVADIYPRLGLTSEWDTGAAHAVLKYAGGSCMIHESDQELDYNNKESLLNPFFIAKGY